MTTKTVVPVRLPWWSRCIGGVLAAALRALAASWVVEPIDTGRLVSGPGTPRFVGFWHGEYFALLPLLCGTRCCVLIGEGFRGTLIAAIVTAFGYTPLLLPHGDRERAVGRIRAQLAGPLPCATAFDGPTGPARRVKPSLVRLAAECGATIVPVSLSARPCFVAWWRWDRRELPLPFARVRIHIGNPIAIPAAAIEGEALAHWRGRVGDAVDGLVRTSVQHA